MKIITSVVLSWTAMLISVCSYANDSIARVGAGGLELLKTERIQMVSEVLEISTSTIKVKYHFLNTSNNDIQTTVAFPMPAFDETGNYDGSKENQKPLDSFRISVNGALLPVQKNRVFLINNVDVTDKFRTIGLSDEQIFDSKFTCTKLFVNEGFNKTCKLTAEQLAAMRNMSTGGNWQIKETAYWEQTFPAGKEIVVIHEYEPFVGQRYSYTDIPSENGVDVCLDDKTFRAITKRVEKSKGETGNPRLNLKEVEYILGTGRNWHGPIKSFKLILKKDSPNDIVTLCFPGRPLKTSSTTIEFSQSDFVPQDKLIVYFYHLDP